MRTKRRAALAILPLSGAVLGCGAAGRPMAVKTVQPYGCPVKDAS
ncbi:hypothetical protein [Methylobacterium nodulans]|uniref:Lipoprotein n=1 Tax=Methylobacterium nodulans (strain LMG 21967 / CNCM I-2342 / ORS 2060) TaxID=460265 RepID=B8IMZ6_METNO|nr:hypothetical protein [Methylobacterium nodulans]ACL62112.1 hypothetical protein Mnod_7375 [Methylobacterium nodulans ORS 2060]